MSYSVVASSGAKSADAQIKSNSGTVWGAQLKGGSDTATLVLYDGTDATGKKIAELSAAAGALSSITFPAGVSFADGLWADVSGTGPSYVVWNE